MAKYSIEAEIKFDVELEEIDAENETDAKSKAKELIDDMYHTNAHGAYHDHKTVSYKMYAYKDD